MAALCLSCSCADVSLKQHVPYVSIYSRCSNATLQHQHMLLIMHIPFIFYPLLQCSASMVAARCWFWRYCCSRDCHYLGRLATWEISMQAALDLTIEQKAAMVLLYRSFRSKFQHTQQEQRHLFHMLSQVSRHLHCKLCCRSNFQHALKRLSDMLSHVS